MRFKIKVNYRHKPAEWWCAPRKGVTPNEADAFIYTREELIQLGLDFQGGPWMLSWLSLKLVP